MANPGPSVSTTANTQASMGAAPTGTPTITLSDANMQRVQQTATPYRGFVASNGWYHSRTSTDIQWMTRSVHVAAVDITSLQVLFANLYGANLIATVNQVVKAAIEYTPPGGAVVNIPLTFAGAATVTLPANVATITPSDPVEVQIPAGTTFFIRNLRTQASGDAGHSAINNSNVGQCGTHAVSVADLVSGTGAFASTDIFYCAPPLAIVGLTTQPSYLLIGDSRVEGFGDQSQSTTAPATGELARGAYAANVGFCNMGVITETAATVAGTRPHRFRMGVYSTHVVSNYGINDIGISAATPAQILANQAIIAGFFPGRRFYVATLPPNTNAGNTALTLSAANEASRQQYNINLRLGTQNAAIAGTFDVARYLEVGGPYVARGQTGFWISSTYTSDGLHESQTGDVLLAPFVQAQIAPLVRY